MMAEQDVYDELNRQRNEIAGVAGGMANLSGMVLKLETRLENIVKAVDGNGRGPLTERMALAERQLAEQTEVNRELTTAIHALNEIRTTITMLVKERDDSKAIKLMVWSALIVALVTAATNALPVLFRLLGK